MPICGPEPCSLLFLVALAAGTGNGPGSPLWQAYQRADRFCSPRLGRLVDKDHVDPHWTADGTRFWYLNEVRGEREFVAVDAVAARRGPAFDHAALAAALGRELGRELAPAHLPFTAIELLDGGAVAFACDGRRWRFAPAAAECTAVDEPPTAPDQPPATPPEPAPGLSPDGRWTAVDQDHNVWLRPADGGAALSLTSDGNAEHGYRWLAWSPDSQRLVVSRVTPGDHRRMYVVEAHPADSLRPKLRDYEYDLPGDRVDVHELYVAQLEPRRVVKAAAEPIDWGGPPQLHWRADGRRLLYVQTHRGHQRVCVVELDTADGAARTLIDERSASFLDPNKQFCHFIAGGAELLWASERSGWNHLYLVDGETGRLENAVTSGDWAVRRVERVDEEARQILFTAGGREPGQDPYLLHWYRVDFDGGHLTRLTEGAGDHRLSFSPDRRFYLDTWSRVDLAPVTELRRTRDGALVCPLEQAEAADLLATGWRWPEPFSAKGRDGETDIWGVIYRPSTFDAAARYPVIELIYAGPHGASVPHSFAARREPQALAELGFIVVQIDGMGTSYRSKAFHDVAWHNLADSGFPDRIAWLRAAAAKYPQLDLARGVGIYGYSAGGYNAARALIDHPELYTVAVALAGNHDHRTDKAVWNEIWMGYPVGDHYAAQSNVTCAARLRGKLLLVHGELDDNVNPSASTLQLADALIRANQNFDLLIVPGAGHNLGQPYVQRRIWDHFVGNLLGEEPPDGFELTSGSGASCDITIRNGLATPVGIYWVDFEGRLRKYHDLAAGAEVVQHTYEGHDWEAQVDGRTVSRYTAAADEPVWEIRAPGR